MKLRNFLTGLSFMIVALAGAVSSASVASAQTTQTFNSGGCTIKVVKPKTSAFNYSGNLATVPLSITGPSSCKATISVASWNAPAGVNGFRPFENQQFFSGRTLKLGPGSYNVHVDIRTVCNFQTDVLNGSRQKSLGGNANYGSELMGYLQVSKGVCPDFTPPPPPVDACPNIDGMQVVVPNGLVKDVSGNCVSPPNDVCPNIDGMQTAIPAGDVKDASGNCVPHTDASFTCDNLGLTIGNNRTVTISAFSTTASNGAVFKNTIINWGDNSATVTTTSAIGQNHQYAQDGTYVVLVVATFTVNGSDVTATSADCTKTAVITTQAPVVPPTTPPTIVTTAAQPTSLVNTGPGSVIAIFAAVSLAGAFLHRQLLRKIL